MFGEVPGKKSLRSFSACDAENISPEDRVLVGASELPSSDIGVMVDWRRPRGGCAASTIRFGVVLVELAGLSSGASLVWTKGVASRGCVNRPASLLRTVGVAPGEWENRRGLGIVEVMVLPQGSMVLVGDRTWIRKFSTRRRPALLLERAEPAEEGVSSRGENPSSWERAGDAGEGEHTHSVGGYSACGDGSGRTICRSPAAVTLSGVFALSPKAPSRSRLLFCWGGARLEAPACS
mmetsp:Transcript_4411/g.10395  ORF Transcript_4411/g.10395 Transcript_4411/m.10395 type:complete len:236 (-) Transcript_4411:2075-2782(-)